MADAQDGKGTRSGGASSKLPATSAPQRRKQSTLDQAETAAREIFQCYPDYGTAAPEYIVNIIRILKTFSPEALKIIADLREGVVSQCRNLPTVADIIAHGTAAERRLEEEERLAVARPKVPVVVGTPEWWAWREHLKGKPIPVVDVYDADGKMLGSGWYFPSATPPK